MKFGSAFLLSLLVSAAAVPAAAQEAPAEAEPVETEAAEEEDDTIVVTGERLRGAVLGDIPPELTLDPQDIQSYGAGSISELLDALAPQTRSGRGRGGERPVILLNGRRISGFSEIRDIPPEALERVDVLPEEVALRYGYRADQRVVNFVLRENFRAVTAELEYGMPTAGGRESYEADLNYLTIAGASRFSFDVEAERDTFLFESERDLVQTATDGLVAELDRPLLDDLGRFRTLLPRSDRIELNSTYSRMIFETVSATLNARLDLTESESRFGLPSATLTVPGSGTTLRRFSVVPGPLTRETEGATGHVGLGLNGDLQPWRWSFTANWDRSRSETETDAGLDAAPLQQRIDAGTLDPFAPLPPELIGERPHDFTRSVSESANAEALANGPLLRLPAGQATASLKAGAATRGFHSRAVRGGVATGTELSRQQMDGQASFDLPIASRREGFLDAIGDLSANLNLAVQHLSDFGTLKTLGYGINWQPIEDVSVIASVTQEEGAPGIQQLGNPAIVTPNVRVFDFTRGETVDVDRVEGGNPALLADHRRVMRLGVTVRPLGGERNLSLSANYTDTRILNPIAEFPTATPEIEAAFPDRFVRDQEGRLVRIDARPVNFARSDREELRWGVNFFAPFGPEPEPRGGRRGREGRGPQGESGEGGAAQRERRGRAGRDSGRRAGPGGRGGFRGFGRGGRGRGRIQLSLYHNWRFQDEVLIRPGVPVLDFLGGSAAGSRGGRPAHEIEFQAGVFRNGLGARLTAQWQSETFVRGVPDGSGGSSGDLFFSNHATVNLRLFANLGQQRALVRDHRWLRGVRVSLAVNNLFDSRLTVRDENGATPISYQPALIDPLGRTFRISLRKQFW